MTFLGMHAFRQVLHQIFNRNFLQNYSVHLCAVESQNKLNGSEKKIYIRKCGMK